MRVLRYKHLLLTFLLVMLLSFIIFYLYMTALPQENNRPKANQTIVQASGSKTIRTETKVYLQQRYEICEAYDLNCEDEVIFTGPARAILDNITAEELEQKYPREAGWNIIWQNNKVVLQQSRQGLCPLHQKRWHLGLDGMSGKVVVYQGPSKIGDTGGIAKETDIVFENLPPDLQQKIQQQMMEFIDWDELIGTLDSLDE